MDPWFTASDLAGLPGMPVNRQHVTRKARQQNWQCQKRSGRGGGQKYHLESLPTETRAHLMSLADEAKAGSLSDASNVDPVSSSPSVGDRLARVSVPESEPSDKEQREIFAKLAIVQAFEAFCADAERIVACEYDFCEAYTDGQIKVDDWVRAEMPKISRSTLTRYKKAIREGEFTSLAGDYKGNTTGTIIDSQPLLRQYIEGLIAKNPVKINRRYIYQVIHHEFPNAELPSLPTLRRWIDNYVEQNKQSFALLRNPDDWKNRYMPAFGSYAEGADQINRLWELDSTPADLALVVGRNRDGTPKLRRYHLVGCIDVYSRRAKLLLTPTSRSAAIAALIRACILDWGVPEAVKTDNGSDYKSIYIEQVFASLGVEQHFCKPYSPEQKPHIERFLGTFSHGLAAQLPGYLGHDVATRKAIEAQRSFADRLGRPELLEIPLEASQFQGFAAAWCQDFYGNQPHQGLGGRTPNMVANDPDQQRHVRRIADERVLDLLLSEGRDATVQKKGIRVDGGHFIAPELGGMVRDRVHIRFTDDAGRIAVFADHRCREFICIAQNPELTGLNRQEVARAAKAISAQQRQAVKALKAAAKTQGIDELPWDLIAAARENAAATHPGLRPPLPGGEIAGELASLPEAALEAVGYLAGMDVTPEPQPLTPEAAAHWAEVEAANAAEQERAQLETPEAKYYRVWRAVEQGQGAATEDERQWLLAVRATDSGPALEAQAELLWTLDKPSAEAV